MITVAITGGFASGKSYVLGVLKDKGYKTFSCDRFVKDLYDNKEIQKELIDNINGFDIFDKAKLSQLLFAYANVRNTVEMIAHPIVLDGIKDFIKKPQG